MKEKAVSQDLKIFRVEDAVEGQRLDRYLATAYPNLTRSQIKKLIEAGNVLVNASVAKPALKLKKSDYIELRIPSQEIPSTFPQDIPIEVIYQDTNFIVVNKPAGLTMYPAPGHASYTLVNALLHKFPDLEKFGNTLRPGIVHRLDKDTSGLVIIARNEGARRELIDLFKKRSMVKGYIVLVKGKLEPENGAIEAPIGRKPTDRKKMAVTSCGKPARTDYKVIRYINQYSLIEAKIHTGRTHQIRVHFASIGYPVVGDSIYGVKTAVLKRQFLHAYFLKFRSSLDGKLYTFRCDLPSDLKTALQKLAE